MIKLYPKIHNIDFKLRIKKHRNDAGQLTLGITLRPKIKLGGNQRNMSFHYFSNGIVSKFDYTDQKGYSFFKDKITLREAKAMVIKYLITDYKPE